VRTVRHHEADLGLDVQPARRAEGGSRGLGILALAGRPHDRGTGNHHGAGAPVITDRKVFPVRCQWRLAGPEDLTHISGMMFGRIKIHEIGDLEWQMHFDVGDRQQMCRPVERPRRSAEQIDQIGPHLCQDVRAGRHQRVEYRGPEPVRRTAAVAARPAR